MTEYLETTIDKFIFKVATDRYYSREGLWAQADGDRVRVGLSDFLQQRSGDVAFAEVKPEGSAVSNGDEIATIETIKVNIILASPVTGRVLEVNPAISTAPEAINQDPYGGGWLVVLEAVDWETDRSALLDPQSYLTLIKGQAEQEINQP